MTMKGIEQITKLREDEEWVIGWREKVQAAQQARRQREEQVRKQAAAANLIGARQRPYRYRQAIERLQKEAAND